MNTVIQYTSTPEKGKIMGNTVLILIIFALLAILPAIAASYLLLRQILCAERRIDALESQKKQYESLLDALGNVTIETERTKAKLISLDESLAYLNNKWNARTKAEIQQEKRQKEREEKQNESDDGGVIYENGKPVAIQNSLQFPPPLQQETETPRRRRFGEIPNKFQGG